MEPRREPIGPDSVCAISVDRNVPNPQLIVCGKSWYFFSLHFIGAEMLSDGSGFLSVSNSPFLEAFISSFVELNKCL